MDKTEKKTEEKQVVAESLEDVKMSVLKEYGGQFDNPEQLQRMAADRQDVQAWRWKQLADAVQKQDIKYCQTLINAIIEGTQQQ